VASPCGRLRAPGGIRFAHGDHRDRGGEQQRRRAEEREDGPGKLHEGGDAVDGPAARGREEIGQQGVVRVHRRVEAQGKPDDGRHEQGEGRRPRGKQEAKGREGHPREQEGAPTAQARAEVVAPRPDEGLDHRALERAGIAEEADEQRIARETPEDQRQGGVVEAIGPADPQAGDAVEERDAPARPAHRPPVRRRRNGRERGRSERAGRRHAAPRRSRRGRASGAARPSVGHARRRRNRRRAARAPGAPRGRSCGGACPGGIDDVATGDGGGGPHDVAAPVRSSAGPPAPPCGAASMTPRQSDAGNSWGIGRPSSPRSRRLDHQRRTPPAIRRALLRTHCPSSDATPGPVTGSLPDADRRAPTDTVPCPIIAAQSRPSRAARRCRRSGARGRSRAPPRGDTRAVPTAR
jgi:hypothetical protein